ncbi:MAG: hypothetical protein I3I94_09090 [Acidaminococcaceae bacterium]|nr:hypothetical protein [Acidaminococcaceae bacterium]
MNMLRTVIKGIAAALKSDRDIPILLDEAKDDVPYPCWRIALVDDVQGDRLVGRLHERTAYFDVMLITSSRGEVKDVRTEMLDVGTALFAALEFISADGVTLRGEDMHYRVTDGILHFLVTYTWHELETVDDNTMQTLTVNGGVKDGD